MASRLESALLVTTRRTVIVTAEEKLRASEGMFWAARALEGGALAALHPDWSEAQISTAVREAFLFPRE